MRELFLYVSGFWLLLWAFYFSELYPDDDYISEQEIREFPGDIERWLRQK